MLKPKSPKMTHFWPFFDIISSLWEPDLVKIYASPSKYHIGIICHRCTQNYTIEGRKQQSYSPKIPKTTHFLPFLDLMRSLWDPSLVKMYVNPSKCHIGNIFHHCAWHERTEGYKQQSKRLKALKWPSFGPFWT